MLIVRSQLLDYFLSCPEIPDRHVELQMIEAHANTFEENLVIPKMREVSSKSLLEQYYLFQTFQDHEADIRELAGAVRKIPEAEISSGVNQLIAADLSSINVYLLPFGHPFGDAYVRLENGEPCIFINLASVVRLYGRSTAERIANLTSVIEHEVFHIRFANLRKTSARWASFDESSYANALILNTLDEGIAHFIGHRSRLPGYVETNRTDFQQCVSRYMTVETDILTRELSPDEFRSMFFNGVTGRFWSKYIAVTGMLAAYRILKERGWTGLRACLENPGSFRAWGIDGIDHYVS